jgi:hypothetical protein
VCAPKVAVVIPTPLLRQVYPKLRVQPPIGECAWKALDDLGRNRQFRKQAELLRQYLKANEEPLVWPGTSGRRRFVKVRVDVRAGRAIEESFDARGGEAICGSFDGREDAAGQKLCGAPSTTWSIQVGGNDAREARPEKAPLGC